MSEPSPAEALAQRLGKRPDAEDAQTTPLACKLRQHRERVGLSAEQCANHLGTHFATWYRYEKGTRTPSLPVAMRIAKFFALPVEEIWQLREHE